MVIRRYLESHVLHHREERLTQFGVMCKACGNFIPSKQFEKDPDSYARVTEIAKKADIKLEETCPKCRSSLDYSVEDYHIRVTDVKDVRLKSESSKSDSLDKKT